MKGKGTERYVIAKHTVPVSFPDGDVCCNNCRYCKRKSGLAKDEDGDSFSRYENHICVLTYEPLAMSDICWKIGRLCPLEFEEEQNND